MDALGLSEFWAYLANISLYGCQEIAINAFVLVF
jgi:hypothetical protein